MKINMINTNSVMRTICAVVMLLGMSVSAWGATTGTIEFGNSPKVAIGSASASGDDSQGNTWTITTAGTTSYTSNTDYYQVGSSSKPATSITFTMTLPSSKNITAFSAKFGGFGDTAGTIKLKVGDTEVGSGSLNGTSDVTVSNSSTASGTVLTVTVTSIAKGVKCYYISCTYANSSAYTVTFDAEGGTCATSSLTETSIDGGVILPAATANEASYGWGFYGWAESAVSTIASSASIVGKAGDTYYPSGATTLHAVYAKGEYTKETSAITENGKYLIVATNGGHNYLMTNKLSTYEADSKEYGQLAGKLIDETSTNKYSAASIHADYVFTIVTSASVSVSTGNWMIKNVSDNKYVSADYRDLYITDISSADGNTITSTSGAWEIENVYNSTCKIQYNTSENQFRANSTASSLLIYKETVTPKYCSNPSTVRLVASPAAGGTVVFDDNSSAEMDFATADGYIGDITATPNDGYDFLNWESSVSGSAIEIDPINGINPTISAETSATITAHFYQKRSISYTLTGADGDVSNPTTVTKDEKDGFLVGFNLQAHYKDMTLVSVTMGGSPMTEGAEADYEWEVVDGTAMLTIHHDNIDGDIVITVSATHMEYTKYAFSCAELTLTPVLVTAGTPIFITSAASKMVRSQDKIEITGTGLTPNTTLTFPGLPSKFAIKKADGTALATNSSGVIEEDAYIFYTPDAGDTSDGLDKITGITVSVGGAKPITKKLTQDIIGRHLPADFVIAGKKDNKWYALPSNMASTSTPDPSEIAVDDINNPTIAYTAPSNIYGLEGPTVSGGGNNVASGYGQYVRLTMSIESSSGSGKPAPLFGTSGSEDASSSPKIGKSGTAIATNNLSAGYWWELTQTNTSITNPQDAKYTIKCANNSNTLSIKNSPFVWGLYASGVEELRLIPASDIIFAEANFVEWGQHGGIIEVDKAGIDATSVVAHLGEATSSAISLVQTGTSVKGSATKYNYTVNFGDGIDFAAVSSNGALLTLEWKNGATTKAMTSLVVPKIIASSATMSSIASGDAAWSSAEVHVLPGVTLEANAGSFVSSDVTIDQLEIYPGATVKVTTGTLDIRKLALRNGWKRIGGKAYDVARLHIATTANLTKTNNTDKWYSDWYIDFDQYYPIAVPWPVTVADMSYKNTSGAASVGPTGTMRLRYYDGDSRATNIQEGVGSGTNWKQYGEVGCKTVPTTLDPSHGYAMTARRPTGKAFSIIRMPLTFTNAWGALGEQGSVDETHKDTVKVTAYGVKPESKTVYAEGWNFIANPYMALYQGAITLTPEEGDATTINVVNIPDVDFKEYGQYATAVMKLKPSSGFLIQTPATGTITFGTANRKASAPAYRREVREETHPEQQAYILLSNEDAEDMMGIFVSEKYTADYDLNGDMEKFLSDGTTLRTYMRYNDMNMAYVAIDKVLAQEPIPVSVRIPNDGEYTFSLHEASIVANLEGIYLIDHYEGNRETNLLEEGYTFYSPAGTIADRFTINAKVGARDVPTDIDVTDAEKNSGKAVKFLYRDKLYIMRSGRIYDATGKQVKGGAQ